MRRINDPSSGYQMNVGDERQYANLEDLVDLEDRSLEALGQKQLHLTLNGLVSTRNKPIKSINMKQLEEFVKEKDPAQQDNKTSEPTNTQVLVVTINAENETRTIRFEGELPVEGAPELKVSQQFQHLVELVKMLIPKS